MAWSDLFNNCNVVVTPNEITVLPATVPPTVLSQTIRFKPDVANGMVVALASTNDITTVESSLALCANTLHMNRYVPATTVIFGLT